MIILGSRALQLRAPKLLSRKPLDFDFFCREEELEGWINDNLTKINPKKVYDLPPNKRIVEGDSICEFEIVQPNTSSELLYDLILADKSTIKTSFGLVPSLDLLFTLKKSHRFLKSPHFWKTVTDYHRMKAIGAKVRPEYEEFFKLREKETYVNQKHPKLNVSKKYFFSEEHGIVYEFVHDDLHQSVKLYDKPAYLYYMKDGSEVLSDKNKFFACPREIQLAGVFEEISTLCLERALVPHADSWKSPRDAWMFAASKCLTGITSGFFREFGVENIFDVVKLYNPNFYDKFQQDVRDGKVRRLHGERS